MPHEYGFLLEVIKKKVIKLISDIIEYVKRKY